MKSNRIFSLSCFTFLHLVSIQCRTILDSEPGLIASEIVNAIQQKQLTELEVLARQPRQDDEDVGTSSGTAAASSAASNTAGIISQGTPIGQIIQNIVPDAQGAVVSILKAVSSPFDFISKSVDNYINPTTQPPTTAAPKINSIRYGSIPSGGEITVVLLPEQVAVPVSTANKVNVEPIPSESVPNEGEEEDEESSSNNDDK